MLTNPSIDNSKRLATYDLKFSSGEKQIDWEELLQHAVIRMTLLNLWFHPPIKFLFSSCDTTGFMLSQKSNDRKTFVTEHIHRYRTDEKDAW